MCAFVQSVFAADVKLRARVTPKTAVVRLGDVAEITCADRQMARRLATVPLMPAPAPDTERFLRKREVADMLAASGIALGDVRFDGAEQVEVMGVTIVQASADEESEKDSKEKPINRHAAVLAGGSGKIPVRVAAPTPKEIVTVPVVPPPVLDDVQVSQLRVQLARILADYVKLKTGKPEDRRIDCVATDRQVAQLATATSVPICDGGIEPWTGRQKFNLSFMTARGKVQLPIYAEVGDAPTPVIVATRPVARGSVVTAADVEVQKIELNSKNSVVRAAIDSVDRIVGLEAKQALQVGDVVYSDQVQAPMMVKKGDLITVVSQSGGIRVRTTARSLQDGAHGVLVQVESLESKKHYDARVTGLREAAVFAPARSTEPEPKKQNDMARRQLTQRK